MTSFPGELDNYEAMLEMQEVFKNRTKFSMKSDDCELPYTKVGDKCLSLFYPAQVKWRLESTYHHWKFNRLISALQFKL